MPRKIGGNESGKNGDYKMTWEKADKDVQVYCQDDIAVHIIQTGYPEIYRDGSHQKLANFHVIYEDAYGDTGHSILTAQEIKNTYGINVETQTVEPKFESPMIQTRFEAIMRFNEGLGPQNKELPAVVARDFNEAQKLAEAEADKARGEGEWIEVKVRPLGPAI